MIPRIQGDTTPAWQHELAASITTAEELYRRLRLDPADLPAALTATRAFRLRVTASYLGRIRPGDPRDPLLLQVLPSGLEVAPQPPGFSADPVGDRDACATPGVLHKYHGRVLLVTTGACAIHCRYCFRRHYPYAESTASRDTWDATHDYLSRHAEVDEVILSGGDPLILVDDKLEALTARLEAIPHLRRLRIHSRVPVVLPSRIDARLLRWVQAMRLQVVIVLHVNHARELDGEVGAALRKLRAAGVTLLNQSVLLRGVNDDVDTLGELSHALFEHGVLPYYLHLLDRVTGAAHFEVPMPDAVRLHAALSERLPGYLVPRLVREVAGAASKTPVGSDGSPVRTECRTPTTRGTLPPVAARAEAIPGT